MRHIRDKLTLNTPAAHQYNCNHASHCAVYTQYTQPSEHEPTPEAQGEIQHAAPAGGWMHLGEFLAWHKRLSSENDGELDILIVQLIRLLFNQFFSILASSIRTTINSRGEALARRLLRQPRTTQRVRRAYHIHKCHHLRWWRNPWCGLCQDHGDP